MKFLIFSCLFSFVACFGIAQSTHTLYFQNSNTGKGIQDLLLFDNVGLIGITDASGRVTISTPKTQIYVKHISYKDSIINLENLNNAPIQLETRITQMPDVKIEAKYNLKKHLLKLLKQNFDPDRTEIKDTIVFYELEMETEVQDQLMPKEIIHAIIAVKFNKANDLQKLSLSLFGKQYFGKYQYWVKTIKYENQIKDSLTNAFLPQIYHIPIQFVFHSAMFSKKFIKRISLFQMIKDNKTRQTKFNLLSERPSISGKYETNFIFYNDTLSRWERFFSNNVSNDMKETSRFHFVINSCYHIVELSKHSMLYPASVELILSLSLDNNKIVYQTIKLTEIKDKTFDKQTFEKNGIWPSYPRDKYFNLNSDK